MSFDAKDYSISEILTKSVFDIPRNQRRYVMSKTKPKQNRKSCGHHKKQ